MRVVVVGAGISGLAVAHALLAGDAPVDVTVLEASSRPGGVIRTERLDGYLCEWGPNGFLDRAPDTLGLVDALGLRSRVVSSRDAARRRFVLRGGRLRAVPTGLAAFLTGDLLSVRGRLRVALEPFVARGRADDETVHAFAARRFGTETADVLVDAFTTGIFGGPSRELSVRACFPQLWQLEQDHGGVIRGMMKRTTGSSGGPSPFGRLVTLAGGMEELVGGLARRVGPALRLEAPVERIERSPDGRGWAVQVQDGERLAADHVIVATGVEGASRLLQPVDAQLASLVEGIRTSPLAVVCLGYPAAAADAAFDGFGFLVPRGENARILGAVWDSAVFPERAAPGHTLVRVILGGGRDPDVVRLGDDELAAIARRDLHAACGVTSPPEFLRIIRQVPGLPQYAPGHVERLAAVDARLREHPGLRLAGNGYHGVAVNSCIAHARRVARGILETA